MSDTRGLLSSAIFGRFLGTFLPLFGIQFAFGLSGIIYSTFLSRTKDNDSIALLGTVELIQSAICRPFIFTIAEISGVLISRHHGAKEPHLVARAHFQAYTLLIFAMSLYSLMTLWAEPIFLFINTEPQMARQAAAYLRTYLPTL